MKSHGSRFNPNSYFFVIYVTILCEPSYSPDALSSILHARFHIPVDFINDVLFFRYISFFQNLLSDENHLRYHVIYVTKMIP